MKVPFSKKIIDHSMIPFLAFTGVGLFDLLTGPEKRFDQSLALIILFGLPSVLLVWMSLSEKIDFKTVVKVSKKDRFVQLPFSDFYIVLFCSGLLFLGVILIFDPRSIPDRYFTLYTGDIVYTF